MPETRLTRDRIEALLKTMAKTKVVDRPWRKHGVLPV